MSDCQKWITDTLLKTGRFGMDDLIFYMNKCGFFDAPCSGSHHLSQIGGLAKHTQNVMELAYQLGTILLNKDKFKEMENSIIITAALHDLGKMGQFEKHNYIANYLKNGKQSDTKPFVTNPDLLYIDHEIRSVAIAQMFIDLTEDEQFAILYHNGMYGPLKYSLQGKETKLYMIIHWADMWASRVIEKEGKQ